MHRKRKIDLEPASLSDGTRTKHDATEKRIEENEALFNPNIENSEVRATSYFHDVPLCLVNFCTPLRRTSKFTERV